ncbi:MAG: hypothetical protein N2C13_03050, partial [Chloroflexota bacterium]
EELLPDSIDAALQLVEDNPDDPIAYLELAAAFFDEGFPDDAMVSYIEAKNILLRITRPNLPNVDSWVRIEAEKLLNLIES